MGKKRTSSRKPKDDLTKIEGIGPKIAEALGEANINTFARLANASLKRLRKVLEEAGPHFKSHDPTTWSVQAALARDGKWPELDSLKASLYRGKATSAKSDSEMPTATVVYSNPDGSEYTPGQPFIIERLLTDDEEDAEFLFRKNELEADWKRAEKAADTLWKRLKKKDKCRDHITGISVRFRTRMGHSVSPLQVVVAVDVARKIPLEELPYQKKCTRHKDCDKYCNIQDVGRDLGVRIKVLEGQFEFLSSSVATLLTGEEPKEALPFDAELTGGVPIAQPADHKNFGTLGAVFFNESSEMLGITAQHVTGTGTDLDQLAPEGDVPDSRSVAQRQPPLREAPFDVTINSFKESIDAALLQMSSASGIVVPPNDNSNIWARGISHEPDESPSTASAPLPVFFSNRRINSTDGTVNVVKFGNGSGVLTRGKVDNRNKTTIINGDEYVSNFTIKPRSPSNIFATPGDSGSLVAVRAKLVNGAEVDAMVIIGVLFAGLKNSTRGLVCSMQHVIKGLDLKSNNIIPAERIAESWKKA